MMPGETSGGPAHVGHEAWPIVLFCLHNLLVVCVLFTLEGGCAYLSGGCVAAGWAELVV